MTDVDLPDSTDERRSLSSMIERVPSGIRAAVAWALLIAAAAVLLNIVDPGSLESPYTGF